MERFYLFEMKKKTKNKTIITNFQSQFSVVLLYFIFDDFKMICE